ncbi:hypothetical protein ACS0TY_004159 [Phlomoides rotata]
MVIRDDTGFFVVGCTILRPGMINIDEGEAWGLIEALEWAARLGFDKMEVEVDAKQVVDAISTGNEVNSSPLGTGLSYARIF